MAYRTMHANKRRMQIRQLLLRARLDCLPERSRYVGGSEAPCHPEAEILGGKEMTNSSKNCVRRVLAPLNVFRVKASQAYLASGRPRQPPGDDKQ